MERYLEYQFEEISSVVESEYENSIEKIIKEDKIVEKKPKIKNYKDLFNLINKQTRDIGDVSYMHESHIEEEIGKCDLNGEGESFDIGNVNQHVMIIRLLDVNLRNWVHTVIISPYIQMLIMDVQVGVSREGLSASKLMDFFIPIPPQPEMSRILNTIDDCTKLLS